MHTRLPSAVPSAGPGNPTDSSGRALTHSPDPDAGRDRLVGGPQVARRVAAPRTGRPATTPAKATVPGAGARTWSARRPQQGRLRGDRRDHGISGRFERADDGRWLHRVLPRRAVQLRPLAASRPRSRCRAWWPRRPPQIGTVHRQIRLSLVRARIRRALRRTGGERPGRSARLGSGSRFPQAGPGRVDSWWHPFGDDFARPYHSLPPFSPTRPD